jgi:phenylalanyl-tRNA synthetase beta chain
MKVPLSWVKDFVDITIPVEDLAHRLTMAGLEVEEIRYIGLPFSDQHTGGSEQRRETKVSGLEWDPERIVVGEVREVNPHPNADRLVLCRLYDGQQEHTVLTGAPNLFPYKGQGPLDPPLKVAYAKEGARLYDGHQPGFVLTTLKRAKIRGVESYSMICSEKELGISEEHEGVIILDPDAPTGMPLVEYMGDAVLEIAITPNIARNANILGVAREIAALTGQRLRYPNLEIQAQGEPVQGQVELEIRSPELNPRFVLGLIRNVKVGPSPYWVQRRLRLAGMRPINNIVDSTNYAMLEIGEPLHAFDYDALVQRAAGKTPRIITRTAQPGEKLVTLDDVERTLDDQTVLVTDTAGPLSIGGVIGGAETEVSDNTRNVLLEGAAWNFINIRRTLSKQRINTEAAYRFSRGVHPAMAERGVRRGLILMQSWAGGEVARGLVDEYPLPQQDPVIEVSTADVRRWLGIDLDVEEIAGILHSLEFDVEVRDGTVRARTPDHRLDIGEGIIGLADILEEIARIYGYERIPETRLADTLPLQCGNPDLEREERVRDLLVELGLQEVISYRMTTPAREARLGLSIEPQHYVRLANPISSDRDVLRQNLLPNLMEVAERNGRLQDRIAIFEIGAVFYAHEDGSLPDELPRLGILMTGPRDLPSWQDGSSGLMDFYDLKGVVESLLDGLHITAARFEPAALPAFHPGKCARVYIQDRLLGVMGELHPQVRERYDLPDRPVLAADLDLSVILQSIPELYPVTPVPAFPPALEDLAVIVDEDLPAARVEEVIRRAGGEMVTAVRLFDVYRGEQIGAGKKSLAYSVTYQAVDHTLTDKELQKIRQRIIRRLEQELGAHLRS